MNGYVKSRPGRYHEALEPGDLSQTGQVGGWRGAWLGGLNEWSSSFLGCVDTRWGWVVGCVHRLMGRTVVEAKWQTGGLGSSGGELQHRCRLREATLVSHNLLALLQAYCQQHRTLMP